MVAPLPRAVRGLVVELEEDGGGAVAGAESSAGRVFGASARFPGVAEFATNWSALWRLREGSRIICPKLPDDHEGRPAGYLMVNSPLEERPHDREPHPPDQDKYVDRDGLMHQCAHCRRVQDVRGGGWDWVPDWVEAPPPSASHGLCPVCCDYFFAAA